MEAHAQKKGQVWVVFADGSADAALGIAAWGAVLLREGHPHYALQGWRAGSDSAWAEVQAVRIALIAVPDGARVVVHTDALPLVEVWGGRGAFGRGDLRQAFESFRADVVRRGIELTLRHHRRVRGLWAVQAHRLARTALRLGREAVGALRRAA